MKLLLMSQMLIIVLITTLAATAVQAHKVRIFAWQEGTTVFTETKFSGGKPAKNVSIFVEDPATQKRLISGSTDATGNFSFTVPNPQPESLVVVADGGDGHRSSWTHSLEKTKKTTVSSPGTENNKTLFAEPLAREVSANPDLEQLTAVLEEVMDKKLSPIKKTLAETRDTGPSLQDILGGIGYIFGLAGIAAYFRSKKR